MRILLTSFVLLIGSIALPIGAMAQSSHDDWDGAVMREDVDRSAISERSASSPEAADSAEIRDGFRFADVHETIDFPIKFLTVRSPSMFALGPANALPHDQTNLDKFFNNSNFRGRISDEILPVTPGSKYAIVFICNNKKRSIIIAINSDKSKQSVVLTCS